MCSWCGSFGEVDSGLLGIAFHDILYFVMSDFPTVVMLLFTDKLPFEWLFAARNGRVRDKNENVKILEGVQFLMCSSYLVFVFRRGKSFLPRWVVTSVTY